MKKIYINENSIKSVVNGRLLPQYLFKLVKSHTTSLGDNEIFPSGDEYPFDYILLKERFNEISDVIEELGIQDISEDGLMSELSSLLKECKELETPIRDSLERICENAVNRLFAIPKDIINIKCKLVDKIKFKKSIRLRPESDEDIEYSFEDVQDIEFSKKAIGKRRVIDSLIQGGSYLYANIIGLYASEINKINPRLLQLYRIITAINDYLLFIKKEEMTDDKPMQGSYVETHLGMGGDKTTISAQGLIFPLLLQETIRGMFELFSAHGLPQDTKKAQYVVKKADFVLAEPWDLRLGVGLWKRVFGKIQDTNMIPYMFQSLASLNTDEFYLSMKEILSLTKKGNEIIDNLMASAEHDNGYQQFTNRINDKNLNQSLINDSYFNGAETNGYEVDDETTDGEVIEEDGVNELSHDTYQSAADSAFDKNDTRVSKFRKQAEIEYNKNSHNGNSIHNKFNNEQWITLNNGKKLVIFDQQYKSLKDLYDGVKMGRLLIHARGMNGEVSNDMRYIEPCFSETMKEFYGGDYDDMAQSKSEYYGEEIEPEYPELIFASDDFSWCKDSRNGVFFIESDGFQKSLGNGIIQFPNGKICKYWESDIYDYDDENFKDEPWGVEYGDWYSKDCATVVAVMNLNDTIKEDIYRGTKYQEIETWYRGICGNFNESLNKRQIWLAETPEYAAQYAEECEDGHLYAFDVDMSRYKDFDWYYNAPNWFEPIDGFSDEEQKELMQEGYNGYMFPLDDCTVLVLFDPSLIVNVREIPLSDYLEESNSYNQQENELIIESQESKSIHINKDNKLNESKQFSNVRLVGMCDYMNLYVNNKKVASYNYEDSTAYPFIIYKNQLYIGDKGKAHNSMMRQIPHFRNYEDAILGRIWVSAKSNEFNYALVAFWGTNNTTVDCKPYVLEVAKSLKVNPNKIVVIVGYEGEMNIQTMQEWNGYAHEATEEEQQAQNLHMMNAKDKYDNTSDFRQTRDRKIGEKLSNDKGQEMPFAQYHNLIYQEGKKNKGIFVTEEQYKKLIENIIPIESGVINKDKYQGNLADKEFYYFGDCKNTVDVDKMWNATQMSNFLENSQLINPKHVINKLHNGDRIMPKPLLKAINNPKMQIVCGINEYQKIMFIYLTDNDTHYFFDVMNNNRKTKAYLLQKNNIRN